MDFAAVSGVDNTEESNTVADDDDDNDDLVVQHSTPVGSKFGEQGERLRSAARRRGRPTSATGITFTQLKIALQFTYSQSTLLGSMMSVSASIAPDSGEHPEEFNGDVANGGVEGAPPPGDDDDVDVDLGW